jgi:hypothetical protein
MVLWGIGSRRGQVPGGKSEQRFCADCEKQTRFVECNVTDSLHVFFVELGGVRQQRMICCECGQDQPVELDGKPVGAAPKTAAPTPKARASDKELSRRLAELKKKMGQ